MPKVNSNSGPVSRNIHHGNKINKKGYSAHVPIKTEHDHSYNMAPGLASSPTAPVYFDGVIRGRPPHSPKAKRTVVLERRFTLPDVTRNADIYIDRMERQIHNFQEVLREFHSTSRQVSFYQDTEHDIEILDI